MRALRDGIRRVYRAPAILAGMWLLTLATMLPLALAWRDATGLRPDAHATTEPQQHATSALARAFEPTATFFGAELDTAGAFAARIPDGLSTAAAAIGYVAVWAFLAGGIIDRYARDRPTRAFGFFSACGGLAGRFIRLAIVMAIVYTVLFAWISPWLFDSLYPRMIRNVRGDGIAGFARLTLDAVFYLALAGCNLIFDYASVRAVVEDRRSMLGSIAAAVRFIGSNYDAVVPLYVADIFLFVLTMAAYAVAAPDNGAALPVWLAFAIGQAYVVARLWVKLVFWASETSLFQSRLAHAGYIARPMPQWPESAEAEAIGEI